LFGNRSEDDILLKEELEQAAKDPRINVYFTVDKVTLEDYSSSISRPLLIGLDLLVSLLKI